jgi:hypothetical protein
LNFAHRAFCASEIRFRAAADILRRPPADRRVCPTAKRRSAFAAASRPLSSCAIQRASIQCPQESWQDSRLCPLLGRHRSRKRSIVATGTIRRSGLEASRVAHEAAIPYFTSRKLRKRSGNAAESSCQVRILHFVLSSVERTQLMTPYQSSIRSGRRASSSTQNERPRA